MERHQPGRPAKGAFRKEQRRASFPRRGRHCPVVFQTLSPVEALDENAADPLHRQAGVPGGTQLRLGDEGDRPRQRRHQHQDVEVAGVVGDQHARLVAEMLEAADQQAGAGNAKQQPRRHADRSPPPA